MTDSERQLLVDVRRKLLHLHKTLLDWERAAYHCAHGRTSPGQLLKIVMTDPQFAWLRPVSELIVRIDEALDMEAPDAPVDVEGIIAQARLIVAPERRQRLRAAIPRGAAGASRCRAGARRRRGGR